MEVVPNQAVLGYDTASMLIDNLREKLPDVDITVLSQDPEQTAEKFGVKSVRRMSLPDIFRAVGWCDLLLSGGGSLLQDATSGRSILYYLFILGLAQLLGRQTFIYSQGIGPIASPPEPEVHRPPSCAAPTASWSGIPRAGTSCWSWACRTI